MLIFSPKNPQYTITVFTDVDCQYCRKLHSEMAELNKLGCACATCSFRAPGPNTESWRKAEVVWCSADRNEALTRAKAGAAAGHEQDLRADAGGARICARAEHRGARHARDRHRERRLHQRLHAAAANCVQTTQSSCRWRSASAGVPTRCDADGAARVIAPAV